MKTVKKSEDDDAQYAYYNNTNLTNNKENITSPYKYGEAPLHCICNTGSVHDVCISFGRRGRHMLGNLFACILDLVSFFVLSIIIIIHILL